MSSWLAALGPCASPKSKAKGRNKGNTLERPVNLSSLQRRGSLTDIKNTRKVTSQRSFREKLHDTFDGSLRRAKKAGSLEAVPHGGHTISNPDTNMNLATSLSPKAYGSVRVQGSSSEQGSPSMHEKFWTNFYNTLPRNRYKGDRPKDLSLQDLPVTERTDSEAHGRNDIQQRSLSPSEGNAQWQVYATSPRTKRKNRSLERMNSAPSTRKSPMRRDQDETRPGSDGKASPQMLDAPVEYFDSGTGSAFVILPRSVSLQEEYWVPGTKGAHKRDLRKISPSPERIIISQGHSPMGSPVQVQGHVWVKTKDGSHLELRPVECAPRDLPSPSESQKTDMSSLSYITAESSLSNQPSPIQKQAPGFINTTQTQEHPYLGPYLTPEEYQANIFDLIQSLNQNQSPPNPGSPQEKQPTSLEENRGTEGDHESKTYHSEKFIVLGSGEKEPTASKQDGGNFEKREQPIFSVRAHVFQIDPETKKNWISASKTAVAVSYYYDSARHTYRIISVEGSKAIINSTITPNMAFTKTSQKFGQWSDPRANTVYGLGFGSESDLAKFIEKFKEVKDLTRQQILQSQSPITVNGTESDSAQSTPRDSSSSGQPNRGFFHTRSSSLTSMRDTGQKEDPKDKDSVNLRERRNSFNTSGTNGNSPESQLKYENDKLKLALAQSSANAKKWEIELQTLKNNNARLTAALQESTANVDEWKRQLAAYKDESSRMKKKVSELEKKAGTSDQVVTLEEEIDKLSDRVESLQRDNQFKDEEVDRLQQRLAEMNAKETANGNLQSKIKTLEEENKSLTTKVHELQNLLQNYRTSQDKETEEMLQLHSHLGSKITELYEFHEQIVATLRKESNS